MKPSSARTALSSGGMETIELVCVFFHLAFAFPWFTRVKCKRKKMKIFPLLAFCVEVVHWFAVVSYV